MAAAALGLSPKVVASTPDLIVHEWVFGRELKEGDLVLQDAEYLDLVKEDLKGGESRRDRLAGRLKSEEDQPQPGKNAQAREDARGQAQAVGGQDRAAENATGERQPGMLEGQTGQTGQTGQGGAPPRDRPDKAAPLSLLSVGPALLETVGSKLVEAQAKVLFELERLPVLRSVPWVGRGW